MKLFNVFSVISLILVIVGALNWLCVGIFGFNFVNWLTFGVNWIERAVYVLVGVASLFLIVWLVINKFDMTCPVKAENSSRF